ncbi:MAG: hypothetical protein ABJC12_02410 [Saprospiraceae bacterium]
MKNLLFLILLLMVTTISFGQEAELHINNNSDRSMEIKIMRSGYNGQSTFHSRITISPNSYGVKYFSSTGYYFLKVKASRYGRPTVFTKGDAFRVYVGTDGYDVLTISYSIQESTLNPLSGSVISQSEFEKDY